MAFAIAVFFFSSITKFSSLAFGDSRALRQPDALTGIQTRNVMVSVAVVEFALCIFLAAAPATLAKVYVLTFVVANILLYRLAMLISGPSQICPCLGSVSAWLPVPPSIVSAILWLVVILLMIGALILLRTSSDGER